MQLAKALLLMALVAGCVSPATRANFSPVDDGPSRIGTGNAYQFSDDEDEDGGR